MEQIGNMKLYSLEEVKDELLGKVGTPARWKNTIPLSCKAISAAMKGVVSYTLAYDPILKGPRLGDFATTRGSNCFYV